MSQTYGFNFCPQCGAAVKDGVCSACGYRKTAASSTDGRNVTETAASADGYKSEKTVFDYRDAAVTTSISDETGTKVRRKGIAVLVFTSVFILAVFVLVLYLFFHIRYESSYESRITGSAVDTEKSTADADSFDKPVDNGKADDNVKADSGESAQDMSLAEMVLADFDVFSLPEETAEAEEDGYDYYDVTGYYVYDDYIRTDLDYKIVNMAWEYSGYRAYQYVEGAPIDVYIYCTYPNVTGCSPKFADTINSTVRKLSAYICDMYEADCEYLGEGEIYYGDEHVYVTYMDENVLSLLFVYDGYFASDSEEDPRLVSSTVKAVNYDMVRGVEIPMPGLSVPKDSFIDMFVKGAQEQNEYDILDDVDLSDIKADFDAGLFQWFYNPFGAEIAYCVPGNYGFYSCTMNPDEIFSR